MHFTYLMQEDFRIIETLIWVLFQQYLFCKKSNIPMKTESQNFFLHIYVYVW